MKEIKLGETSMAEGAAKPRGRTKVFDWDEAARLIVTWRVGDAEAGLAEDWPLTSGKILRDWVPLMLDDDSTVRFTQPGRTTGYFTYHYLLSGWATPALKLGEMVVECWKYRDETPGWDKTTSWPPSALQILASRLVK